MNDNFWVDRCNRRLASVEWDTQFNTGEWCLKIPSIPFKRGWKIKIIPPFAGAVARFLVEANNNQHVSVYLDCYGMLGACDIPYWEVYPYDNDTFRCPMENVEELVEAISHSLKEIKKLKCP